MLRFANMHGADMYAGLDSPLFPPPFLLIIPRCVITIDMYFDDRRKWE